MKVRQILNKKYFILKVKSKGLESDKAGNFNANTCYNFGTDLLHNILTTISIFALFVIPTLR